MASVRKLKKAHQIKTANKLARSEEFRILKLKKELVSEILGGSFFARFSSLSSGSLEDEKNNEDFLSDPIEPIFSENFAMSWGESMKSGGGK